MQKLIRASLPTLVLTIVMLHLSVAIAANDIVRPDGVGALRIGMSISQIERAIKGRVETPTDPEDRICFYFEDKTYPKLDFMIEDGKLRRIDLRTGVSTNDGIQIGDPVSKVKSKYGSRLKIEPHFYSGPEDKYLTVNFRSGKYATRFETHNDLVDAIYTGAPHQTKYVEGCQ